MKHTTTAFLLLVLLAHGVYADIVIIGPETRNGSFESLEPSPSESTDADPWLIYDSVISNASFAAHGNCCAQTKPDVTRSGIIQYFPAVSTSMPNFRLSYKLRNGSPPYTEFRYGLNAHRSDGSWFTSSIVYRSNPPPTDDGWCTHELILSFDEPWDEAYNMQLVIGWNQGETNSIGYLDDVRLTQISDPTRILGMTVTNGTAWLSVQQMAPSNTYSIQRSSDLNSGNWLSVSNLNLAYPGIEWSEELSNQWDKIFYRLKKE